ncbi:apolipoprotein N-acyltransferase [Caulobacter ginsengisoli]|uniref:Apolipoprotein N-acyltransferase n=1 Tax=Caulobacter ginsengisoli TaxID=400775 RepID=A0ABU0ITA7_9CAUL|nr:nitrilase-related carbon-nitrogen hydrolase [Caulobacter ginsengisoli]MDQ0465237.1 apolipoprotein N-acyltransferase [Caulobacter ginsengisoli]
MASITHSETSGLSLAPARPWLWLVLGGMVALLAVDGRFDVPLAAWIAPALLLRFSRTSRPAPAIAGVVVAAGLQMAVYMLEAAAPFTPIAIVLCLVLGLLFAIPYILDRLVGGRLSSPARLLLMPLAWVMTEFAAASLLPVGTAIGTRAVTQAETLALMQVISLFGPYAIGFLIALIATAANQVWERPTRASLIRYGGAAAVVLAAVLAFGEARLMQSSAAAPGPTVKIAGVVPPTALRGPAWAGVTMANWPPSAAARAAVATPRARAAYARVQDRLLADTQAAARSGAKIVQWSETGAPVLEADKPALLARVAALARVEGIYINAAIGVPFERNETYLFAPDGRQLWHYRKNHPVPGMEPVAPFKGPAPVADTPYGRLSSIICYDGDFPPLARAKADILLLPGWDWPEMGHVHTMRLARLRAIENGYALVRIDYQGVSGAFDPYGRVLASQNTLPGEAYTLLVDVPTKGVTTLYGMTGDLFVWLCVLATLGLCGLGMVRRRGGA